MSNSTPARDVARFAFTVSLALMVIAFVAGAAVAFFAHR